MAGREGSLGARVAELVDRHHGGSVNAAATHTGVPQPTLRRLVEGKTRNPHAHLLTTLAGYYDVDVGWLLTGQGRGPADDATRTTPLSGEWIAWAQLVASLPLDDATREALLYLPTATVAAFYGTGWREMVEGGAHLPSAADARQSILALGQANGREVQAWTFLLRQLISLYGAKSVAANLTGRIDEIRLGFNPLAVHLRREGMVRTDLDAAFTEATKGLLDPRARGAVGRADQSPAITEAAESPVSHAFSAFRQEPVVRRATRADFAAAAKRPKRRAG